MIKKNQIALPVNTHYISSIGDWARFIFRGLPLTRNYLEEFLCQAYIEHRFAIPIFYACEIALPCVALLFISIFPHAMMFAMVAGYFLPRTIVWMLLIFRRNELRYELLNVLVLLLICVEMSDQFIEIFRDIGRGLRSSRPMMSKEIAQLCQRLEYRDDAKQVWQEFADKFQASDFALIVDMLYINQVHGSDSSQSLKEQIYQFQEQRLALVHRMANTAEIVFKALHVVCFLPIMFIVIIGPIAISIAEDFQKMSQKQDRLKNVQISSDLMPEEDL